MEAHAAVHSRINPL